MVNVSESHCESDAQLVARVRAGDLQAYGQLIERYEHALLSAVLPSVVDLHAARDVVQDVFLHCLTALHTLRDGNKVGYWLMRSARREAVRAARKTRRARTWPALMAPSPAEDISGDEKQRLLELVVSLPEQERLMISLRYFEGHNTTEIAQMTGCPIGTVTKRLSRAV